MLQFSVLARTHERPKPDNLYGQGIGRENSRYLGQVSATTDEGLEASKKALSAHFGTYIFLPCGELTLIVTLVSMGYGWFIFLLDWFGLWPVIVSNCNRKIVHSDFLPILQFETGSSLFRFRCQKRRTSEIKPIRHTSFSILECVSTVSSQ